MDTRSRNITVGVFLALIMGHIMYLYIEIKYKYAEKIDAYTDALDKIVDTSSDVVDNVASYFNFNLYVSQVGM